jgi:hypothetical protein
MLSDTAASSVRPSSSSQRKEQTARVGSANKQTTDNDRSIASKTLPTATAVSKLTGDQQKISRNQNCLRCQTRTEFKCGFKTLASFHQNFIKSGKLRIVADLTTVFAIFENVLILAAMLNELRLKLTV